MHVQNDSVKDKSLISYTILFFNENKVKLRMLNKMNGNEKNKQS